MGNASTMLQLRRGLAEQDADLNLDTLMHRAPACFPHEIGVKKPGEALFDRVLEKLAECDIEPGQVLHIGARIVEDIMPAKKHGMRTALFAGDSASVWGDSGTTQGGCQPARPAVDVARANSRSPAGIVNYS